MLNVNGGSLEVEGGGWCCGDVTATRGLHFLTTPPNCVTAVTNTKTCAGQCVPHRPGNRETGLGLNVKSASSGPLLAGPVMLQNECR